MQTADPTFTMGLQLLLAARKLEQTDRRDDPNGALQRLAGVYRERGSKMLAGWASPVDLLSAERVNPI
jgi:hypothetical protein